MTWWILILVEWMLSWSFLIFFDQSSSFKSFLNEAIAMTFIWPLCKYALLIWLLYFFEQTWPTLVCYTSALAINLKHFFYCFSFREYPCVEKGYWREKQLNITLPRCGTAVIDEFLPSDQIGELQILANKMLNIFGDTSYTNRESLNLQWLNFHNLFRRNVYRKVLTKSDYQLLRNASKSAKVTWLLIILGLIRKAINYSANSCFLLDSANCVSNFWTSSSSITFYNGHSDDTLSSIC